MSEPRYWIRSSRSQNFNNRVEVASSRDCVRDSKDPAGPWLRVDVGSFVRAVKVGRFDR